VGYSEESRAYKLYGLVAKHVFVNIYVHIGEIYQLTTSPPCFVATNYSMFSKLLKTNSTIINDNEMQSSVTYLMMFLVKMINPCLHVNTNVMAILQFSVSLFYEFFQWFQKLIHGVQLLKFYFVRLHLPRLPIWIACMDFF
jgi:hypothetical protein